MCVASAARTRQFGDDDFAANAWRNVDRPSALRVGRGDRLGHVVGIVTAVLARFESQASVVAVRVLRAHGFRQLSERLYLVHLCLPSFAVREHRATPSETPPTPFPHRANSDAAMTRRADRRPDTAHACAIRRTSAPHLITNGTIATGTW